MNDTSSEAKGFAALNLAPELLEVLEKLNFVTPTPIQEQAIPSGVRGEDIIGIAQTGTGKTLAFGLPIINRFILNGNRSRGRALALLPTRELALQVEETLNKVGSPFRLRTAVLIGGAPIRQQISALRQDPDIIVATPGRLIDHLQSRTVDLRTVDTLVLDEADRMLDMGFAPQIKQILKAVPDERQTLLFSATMPAEIVDIAANYMVDPVRVEIARQGTTADDVTQEIFIVPQEEKNELLAQLLYDYKGTILVFARTRSRAHRVARFVKNAGHASAELHSDRTLTQRRAALDGFKAGQYRVLVATDIAARGIDVSGIELVLNYDLPDNAEDYVHRIGRTGRAGKSGHAISFAAPDQGADIRDIEKLIRTAIEVAEGPHQLEAITNKKRSKRGSGGSRSGNSAPRDGSTPRRDGAHAAAPTTARTPHGLHYSDATYQRSRPARPATPRTGQAPTAQPGASQPRNLTRGGRSFSGRSGPKRSG
ncbi:MAG TPA: DEAD/DEAH box helicase [Abditibacteriaceae bacterium]|jgi:ATP-dependent RNA helicase RhlE